MRKFKPLLDFHVNRYAKYFVLWIYRLFFAAILFAAILFVLGASIFISQCPTVVNADIV